MNRVAWWTCALIALVDARIYERCELARELQELGVHPDNIATWVCIAYHESRFDTGAHNPHSGDYGIFQISELYWCGPGKACGLPCSALRDEDISNDLECALQVHEEHTRLQGNGFLAWVVYPQHCKHNTKKYLVDCDTSVKNPTQFKPRTFTYDDSYKSNFTTYKKQKVEDLLPPYLAIGSIFRGSYGKILDPSQGNVDWINYKVNNIDQLKLPVFDPTPQPVTTSRPTTTSTTTTATYIPPVKPWRTIETNQFRKKQHFDHKATANKDLWTFQNSIPNITFTTTLSPTTTTTTKPSVATSTIRNIATTAWRRPIDTTATFRSVITTRPLIFSSSTYRTSTARTTETQRFFTTTTIRPRTVATTLRPTVAVTKTPIPTTTNKPTTITSKRPSVTTTTRKLPTSTTLKPFSFSFRTSTTTTKPNYSWYTFKSRIANTTPATTKITQTHAQTSRSYITASSKKPETTTQKPRSTQSIFDLYLNPTKPPKLPRFKFSSESDSRFKLKIFSGGTTTSAPEIRSPKSTTGHTTDNSGAAKNYIRRQTPESLAA